MGRGSNQTHAYNAASLLSFSQSRTRKRSAAEIWTAGNAQTLLGDQAEAVSQLARAEQHQQTHSFADFSAGLGLTDQRLNQEAQQYLANLVSLPPTTLSQARQQAQTHYHQALAACLAEHCAGDVRLALASAAAISPRFAEPEESAWPIISVNGITFTSHPANMLTQVLDVLANDEQTAETCWAELQEPGPWQMILEDALNDEPSDWPLDERVSQQLFAWLDGHLDRDQYDF